MATAQNIFLALCVAGAAVAAPQFGGSRSAAGGESEVVTSVISSLTPQISAAVEQALAAIRASQEAAAAAAAAEAEAAAQAEAEAAALAAAQAEANRLAAAQAEADRIAAAQAAEARAQAEAQARARAQAQAKAQAEARRQQQIAAANAAAAAAAAEKNSFDTQVSADLGPYTKPIYNFEYKVADEIENTYISRNEERDGDELSGSYSYVDATGSLVKVDYTAGVNGYAETRTKEAGFVTMKAVPAWTGPLAGVDDAATGVTSVARAPTSTSSSGSSFGSSSSSSGSRFSGATSSTSLATGSSSGINQSDLIAQILAALTPQINAAVASAIN